MTAGDRLRQLPGIGNLIWAYEQRLTRRGQALFWAVFVLGLIGSDTRRTQVYVLFALGAGASLLAGFMEVMPRPRVRLRAALPPRATAGVPLVVRVQVTGEERSYPDLRLTVPPARGGGPAVAFSPPETYLAAVPGEGCEATLTLHADRRGRYELGGAALRSTDPLRLATGRALSGPPQTLLVYPRFWTMEEFLVPLGRRYQPGGIPLSSNTGDAIEFVGTRDYREGDPVRSIHWRSWARRGQPVVKEYQEEYFCRIALILDTFVPRKRGPAAEAAFEAAISVVASIADHFSRSEFIVDILAAGPDVYEVSAGRSLAYLENILDVLACLGPCPDPPFSTIGPALFERLAQITTVVAVLQDWDEPREAFLRRVKALGTSVRAIVVREGETTRPWAHAADDLGEISRMSPADVERAIAESARVTGARGVRG